MRRDAKRHLLFGTIILVFLSTFTKGQVSSTLEALNIAHLSKCQRDVRPAVQMSWRTMAFSRISTGDWDIPSTCEMKDEPAFKPLQGNPAFFWVRASWGPFHLRQKTQSPSHKPIAEGRLLLSFLCKVGLPLQSDTGNHSHPETIWGARNYPQAALLKLMFLYTWDRCLRETLEFPKGSQATFSVWCGWRDVYVANAKEIGIISIWFWVHRAILHSWGEIRVLLFLGQCCWGLSGVQSSKLRLLPYLIGKTQLLCMQFRGIRAHLLLRRKSHGFSRVTAWTWGIFSSYSGDAHSKLKLVQRSPDTCVRTTETSGM